VFRIRYLNIQLVYIHVPDEDSVYSTRIVHERNYFILITGNWLSLMLSGVVYPTT